jgi:indole-3-glycerol phosphate synthase
MAGILQRILRERRADVAAAKRAVPETVLREQAAGRQPRSLRAALATGPRPRIIAELKQASPSAGLLRPVYQPTALAREYEAGGAAALSVLTEPRHFGGLGTHLRDVRAAVALPLLRKDFIVDPYQLLEAAAWGADAVLLIAAALGPETCRALHAAAAALGLETVVEIHSAGEMETALACPDAIIGVNNRNLGTLETNLDVARRLASRIPRERPRVAESGIRTSADIARLEAAGYTAFLVGESLLREASPGEALRRLRGGPAPAGSRR